MHYLSYTKLTQKEGKEQFCIPDRDFRDLYRPSIFFKLFDLKMGRGAEQTAKLALQGETGGCRKLTEFGRNWKNASCSV